LDDQTALVALCRVEDVTPDTPFKAELHGEPLAVFQIGDHYYVTQDSCTHGPGSLAEGYVDGEEIECPFHQGRFDIRTGAATGAPCTEPLRIWQVMVRDGTIWVNGAEHPPA